MIYFEVKPIGKVAVMNKLNKLVLFSLITLIGMSSTGCGTLVKIAGSKTSRRVVTGIVAQVALECAMNGCFGDEAAAKELQESPKIFIEAHFQAINNGEYTKTWNSLSPSFHERQAPKGGYAGYVQWWRDDVNQVSINSINIEQQTPNSAVVDTLLTFHKHSGSSPSMKIRLHLIWEEQSKRWLIDESESI
ncbi:hypothetical protein [[Limnothrix rosea] IAM M-220]|uniref:hypothetical protein n=1 Tax=[Limnothrix rosea] IAM M-220 TaxID=454133 RepID=UPI00095DE496|nr:hypothetical protein [[Limnothrix rosea] IAM M-220]OKH12696.1 hypothetical protein NIES208_15860 [[Limnothrix rosea] IAM M-220]